ncbi:MAG: ABC transporter substrate-binding protein [Lactobacillales bacterium]|jgi:spermidine/putrescine transport system substrate-binding protein|nr:ABC transporter substrate-binding protein [Lactobacillales bacterium]
MRKIESLFLLIIGIILILALMVWRLDNATEEKTTESIVIYNWGDYIDPNLLNKFEKESGLKVIYETFDSNEAMFTKIQQGGTAYDIAIPSEYTIAKMKKENLLYPIDHSKIVGMKNIGKHFLNQPFDRGNVYSVPYFWGTVGIVYNKKLVQGEPPKHWNDLWDKKYKNNILLVDGAREVMGFSLQSLGFSLNSKSMHQLNETTKKLDKMTTNVKAVIADEMKMYMVQGEATVGITFSGVASMMLQENDQLHYVIPSEGSNLWFDNLVIPKTAKNIDGAHKFINFMLRPENAAKNALYVSYATPNEKALKLLPKEVREDTQFYPNDEIKEHLEVYQDLGSKWLEIYNNLFLSFKMYRK